MGALSQSWDRQPPHYVNVDWNDPINRDLMFCTGFPGGAPLNAAVGVFKHGAANGSAGTSLIAEGVAFRGGANKYYSISGSVSVTSATFLAWFVKVTQKDDACLIGSPRGTNSLGLITPALSGNSRVGYMWNGAYWNFDPGSTLNIPTGELVLMAVSVIPTAATLYLGSSGSVKSVTNTNTHASQTVNALVIGADTYSASTRYADGFIPQARFWKRALSSDEIQRLYQTRWRGFAQQPRRLFLTEQTAVGSASNGPLVGAGRLMGSILRGGRLAA